MSDLCLYEFQDNVWDEFSEIDDHIVPRPADDTRDQCTVHSDSHKKFRVEVAGTTSNADYATNFTVLGKREASSQILRKRDKMLDKGSWASASDGPFASCEGDSVKEDTGMASNDSRIKDHCFNSGTSDEPCARDTIMGDPSMSVDNNIYDYHLGHISQSESSLNFFDNGDRESNDLYYAWSDIGNFEDVDKMFRGCDSTFGLGSLSNDDDISWFSPSNAIGGSEDALRSGFKFSCSESTVLRDLENHRDCGLQREDISANEFKKKFTVLYDNVSSQSTCVEEATSVDDVRLVNGSEMKSESKEDSVPQEEMNLPRKQTKLLNQLEEKKKEEYLENGGSLQCYDLSKSFLDAKVPQTDLSPQVQTTESPHGTFFEVPSGKSDGKARPYNYQQLQASIAGSFNHLDVTRSAAISDPVAVLKRIHQNGNDTDDHSEVGVSVGVATGLDNSLAQETSSMSSMLDEISLEATSFRHLQQVMEKLDVRTKLCIRDSLYRLARSAEQRHNCVIPNIAGKNDTLLDDSNKCNAFMDIETDTNPIDRSVAHLLFGRPKDPSTMPRTDPVSPKTKS